MVHFVRLLSAAVLASVSSAAPMMRRDSAIGEEVAVSAPNGIVLSDTPTATAQLSQQTSGSYQSSNYGQSGSYMPSNYQPPSNDCSGDSCNMMSESSSIMMDTTSTMMEDSTSTMLMMETSSVMMDTTSTMMMDTTSTMMMDTTSTMMMDTTSTVMYESTSTSSAYMTYSTPSYGSGNWNYGGSGYNDCVMQCAASFGMPSATWTPSPTQTESSMSEGSSGSNGVTHTIIVAPTKGVLRYVPFSTNASVGDTVVFHWNAGPHTVTQGSALEVCNETANAFNTGEENAGFSYSMVVNDTKPTWFYCQVGTHCKQGMFGGININQPNPDQGSSSYVPLSSMVVNITNSNPDMQAAWMMTKQQVSNNSYANGWGMNINVAGMDMAAQGQILGNVMWTQMLIAQNPTAVDKEKGFQVTDQSLTIPGDFVSALSSAPAAGNGTTAGASTPAASAPAASTPAAGTSAGAASATGNTNGAVSVTSSSVAFAFVAVVASFLML